MTNLDPNEYVGTDSDSDLTTLGTPGGGGGVSLVHQEFSVSAGSGWHYEKITHSKNSEFIIVQVYEWDNANSLRGEKVSADVISSIALELTGDPAADADTANNVVIKINKAAVTGTQYFTAVIA